MLSLKPIQKTDDLRSIIRLYESAFPWCERRKTSDFLKCFDQENFSCFQLVDEELFVGFVTFWSFCDFLFVEHFAIEEHLRGKNFGSLALSLLQKIAEKPIILEVEPPEDLQSKKRIAFYQKNGFKITPKSYLQPSYHGENAIPLRLMEWGGSLLETNFDYVKSLIYKVIYHHEENFD